MQSRHNANFSPLPLVLVTALAGSFIRPFGQPVQQPAAQGYLLAGLVAAPALYLVLSLYGRAACVRRLPAWASLTFAGVLVLSAAMELVQCQRFYQYVLADQLTLFWFLALALGVAGLAAVYSLRALNRVSVLVLGLLVLSLVLLLVSVASQVRFENLQYPAEPLKQAGLGVLARMVLLPEYLLLALLYEAKKPSRAALGRGYALVLGIGFGLESLLAALAESVLGASGLGQSQPVYTIARLGGISVFRRLDAVHVAVWLLLFYLKLSLYFWAFLWLFRRALPGVRRPQAGAAGMLLILCVFGVLRAFPGASGAYFVQQGLLWLLLASSAFWRKQG